VGEADWGGAAIPPGPLHEVEVGELFLKGTIDVQHGPPAPIGFVPRPGDRA
jgi:hypothetical protein